MNLYGTEKVLWLQQLLEVTRVLIYQGNHGLALNVHGITSMVIKNEDSKISYILEREKIKQFNSFS